MTVLQKFRAVLSECQIGHIGLVIECGIMFWAEALVSLLELNTEGMIAETDDA